MRASEIKRDTKETRISLSLVLDGKGEGTIATGCGFFDHMLTLFAKHGRFDLNVSCVGDIEVDCHHTVEDVGICLGRAFNEALGDRRGIKRYGNMILPMDEALILSAVDLSGRGLLSLSLSMRAKKVGDFDTELVEEFFAAFVRECGCTLHIKQLDGKNTHHIIEGTFKSVARSLKTAVCIDADFADEIPSTKGTL